MVEVKLGKWIKPEYQGDLTGKIDVLRKFVDKLNGSGAFERTCALMRQRDLMEAFEGFLAELQLKGIVTLKKNQTRIFISAFMMTKHPEVMSVDGEIVGLSHQLIEALSNLMMEQSEQSIKAFGRAFDKFMAGFDLWKRDDLMALRSKVEGEVKSVADLLSALREQDKQVQQEWLPHVNQHKENMTTMLSDVQQLDGPRRQPVSNAQVAHDLFLEGPKDFDYFALYVPDHQEKLKERIEKLGSKQIANEELFDTIVSIKNTLLGFVEGKMKTGVLIDESIDLPHIKEQLDKKAFDPAQLIGFTLNMMGELCAPVRDDELKALRKNPSLGGILALLSKMSSDMICFELARVMPNLPEIINQYERDAFVEKFGNSKLVITDRLCKRIFKFPEMTELDLAVSFVIFALQGAEVSELLWLDRHHLDKAAERINNLAEKAACRLCKCEIVAKDDPTKKLIAKRLSEAADAFLHNEPDYASKLTYLSADEQKTLQNVFSKLKHMLDHNLKTLKPVYTRLLATF